MAPFIKDKRHLIGLILVFIGIVLIIDNIRFIPHFIPWWIWTWQFLLITIGTFALLTSDNKGPGIVLIGVGTVFLLPDILPDIWPGFFDWFADDTSLFWYLVIIVVGLSLIMRRNIAKHGPTRSHSRRPGFRRGDSGNGSAFTFSSGDQDYIDEVAIFGGGKKIITSENFKGGKLTSIFGGMDLVMVQAKLAEGVVEIEVFALFGGWTLVVPPSWQIKSEVVAIFGGISDKRMIGSDSVRDNTQQLVVKGVVMFGGGEIKSY